MHVEHVFNLLTDVTEGRDGTTGRTDGPDRTDERAGRTEYSVLFYWDIEIQCYKAICYLLFSF